MTKPAERALATIGFKHSLSKGTLMKSHLDYCSRIAAANVIRLGVCRYRSMLRQSTVFRIINGDGEGKLIGMVRDDKYGERG